MQLKEKISTGFKELDKLVDISTPQIIMIVGKYRNGEELSGDIANNICLKQELNVLEIVDSRKEYLIQRMLVNQANVNYRAWNQRNVYTDEELKKIGKSTVNTVYSLKPLPIIIEEENLWPRRKKIKEIVSYFAEDFGEHYPIYAGIIVLDLFEMNTVCKGKKLKKWEKRNEKEAIKIIKDMQKICKKTKCPIIITKQYQNINEKINIEKITNYNKIQKNIDTFITIEQNEIEVYSKTKLVGKTKLIYNTEIRKYEEYKE